MKTDDWRSHIPNRLSDAVHHIRRHLERELNDVERATPEPSAPAGERLAHSLAVARIQGEAQALAQLAEACRAQGLRPDHRP